MIRHGYGADWASVPRDWKLRIADMIGAAEAARRHVSGLDFAAFAANRMVREAVEMELIILGEAASHVPAEVRARHPAIFWERLHEQGEHLIASYHEMHDLAVWSAVQKDLPPLVGQLERLLESER